jgi:ketosteroid isomerase-like protein
MVKENIMNKRETVQALMDAVQKGDFESAKTMLADDFQFRGPVPQPISGEAWLGMSTNLKAAFPDLDYNFKIEGVDGDKVNIAAELKGTHKRDLDLTSMNMGVIPATNKSFEAAHEHGVATMRDGKISAWAMDGSEGAGLLAILDQLGVKPATM